MLPESAREELRKAAQAPAKSQHEREMTIDQTIERLRQLYPSHFKPEVENGENRGDQ